MMELAVKVFFWAVFGVPAAALLIAARMVWTGYALAVLWGWFMVPAFQLPALSVPMAIGVSMVLGGMTGLKRSHDEMSDPAKKWQAFVYPFLSPAFALAFGWIVKHYV
jgi:hypothetical protein